MILWFLMACYNTHYVLTLTDYDGAQEQIKNASIAARIGGAVPGNKRAQRFVRAYAFESLGKLKVISPEIITACSRALLTADNDPYVRTHAAWAIGEIGRDLPWETDAKALHEILIKAMQSKLDEQTAYYVVEALGKIYIQHDHTIDEDLQTVRAMNALAANHKTKLPPIYHIVKFRIETMEVLIVLLKESIEVVKKDSSKVVKAYGASLDVLRFLESHQSQLSTDFDGQKELIHDALRSIKSGFSLRQRSLSLMSIWYLGRILDDPRITDLIAKELIALDVSKDPALRLILQTSMAKLIKNESIRIHFRKTLLTKESQMGHLSALLGIQRGKRDILQQLYGVVVIISAINFRR